MTVTDDLINAAIRHVEACDDALVSIEDQPDLESPAANPLYDGCLACQIREAVAYLLTHQDGP